MDSNLSSFSESIEVLTRLNPLDYILSSENDNGDIVLSWEDNSSSNTGYIIFRKILFINYLT